MKKRWLEDWNVLWSLVRKGCLHPRARTRRSTIVQSTSSSSRTISFFKALIANISPGLVFISANNTCHILDNFLQVKYEKNLSKTAFAQNLYQYEIINAELGHFPFHFLDSVPQFLISRIVTISINIFLLTLTIIRDDISIFTFSNLGTNPWNGRPSCSSFPTTTLVQSNFS